MKASTHAPAAMQRKKPSHRTWARQGLRALALVLCAVLCAFVVSSTLFIARETDHHCMGRECRTCVQLEACAALLRNLGLGVLLLCAMAHALRKAGMAPRLTAMGPRRLTLVTLKVKLSN